MTASASIGLYRTAAACQLLNKVGGSMNRLVSGGVLCFCLAGAELASAQDAIIRVG